MEARDDHHILSDDAVVDTVGKSPKMRTPRVAMDNTMGPGVFEHRHERVLHGAQEFFAQTRTMPLVPEKRLFEVRRCGRPDNKIHFERSRIFLSTTSHGMPIS